MNWLGWEWERWGHFQLSLSPICISLILNVIFISWTRKLKLAFWKCSRIFLKALILHFKRSFVSNVYFGIGRNFIFNFMEELCKTVCSDFETLWINHLKWPTKFTIYPINFKKWKEKRCWRIRKEGQLANKNWLNVQSSSRVSSCWNNKKKVSWADDQNLHLCYKKSSWILAGGFQKSLMVKTDRQTDLLRSSLDWLLDPLALGTI